VVSLFSHALKTLHTGEEFGECQKSIHWKFRVEFTYILARVSQELGGDDDK
jgi:hypothetical protein